MAILCQTLALVQITGQVMLRTLTVKTAGQLYIWLLNDFKVKNMFSSTNATDGSKGV